MPGPTGANCFFLDGNCERGRRTAEPRISFLPQSPQRRDLARTVPGLPSWLTTSTRSPLQLVLSCGTTKNSTTGEDSLVRPNSSDYPTLRSSNSISASSTSHQIQFSTRNPRTRLNSLSLFVASRASRLSACAAISKSMAPIGRPDFSRATLISP